MPRGKLLLNFEKEEMDALRDFGNNMIQIINLITKSPTVIQNYIKVGESM